MSAGHHNVEVHSPNSEEYQKHSALLEHLLESPEFVAALKAFTKSSNEYDIPFLAGSNNRGDTVYFDRRFMQAVHNGKVKYEGQSYDPTPFIAIHEKIESAAIRLLGANYETDNKDGLPGGHLIATWGERRSLDHAGLDFKKYQASLEPFIRADEHEHVSNPPPDLLTLPYKHTPQDKEVEPMAKEGSRADIAQDKREASKRGMSMPQWERSAADRRMDQNAVRRSPGGYVPNFSQEFTAVQDQRKPSDVLTPTTPFGFTGEPSPYEALGKEGLKRMFSPGGEERYKRMSNSPGGYVPNPEQSVAAKQAAATHPRMHALAIGAANLLHPMGHITSGQKARITAKSRNALTVAKKAKAGPPAAPMFGSLAPTMPEPGMGGTGPGMGNPIV